MEEEETKGQCVLVGGRFHALYDNNDKRFYDKHDKFRPDCRPMKNMT